MSAINQKFSVGIGGLLFVSDNEITANATSVIDGTFVFSDSVSAIIPIYAENDDSGDVKIIAVEADHPLNIVQFKDSNNDVIFDARAALGADLDENQAYIFPGNAALTTAQTDDITKVELRLPTGYVNQPVIVKIGIGYNVASGDTAS